MASVHYGRIEVGPVVSFVNNEPVVSNGSWGVRREIIREILFSSSVSGSSIRIVCLDDQASRIPLDLDVTWARVTTDTSWMWMEFDLLWRQVP